MNVNGRLTAPPQDEAELVTNSVCKTLLQGFQPEAGGTPLSNLRYTASFRTRTGRGQGLAGAFLFGPVSATQLLSFGGGVASGI